MAAPSLTYTLTNGSTADASQVMQNFNDLLNGITDGSKDLSISALTCAGTATLNGHVTLGNSSADTVTVTASLASGLIPDATGTRSLGSSALGFLDLYLAASADADTARIIAASHTADRAYTIPDGGANDSFVLLALAQTLTNKTLTSPVLTTPTINMGDGGTLNIVDSDTDTGTDELICAVNLKSSDAGNTSLVGAKLAAYSRNATGTTTGFALSASMAGTEKTLLSSNVNGTVVVTDGATGNGSLFVDNVSATASQTSYGVGIQYSVDTDCTGGYFIRCFNSAGTTVGRIEAASNTTTTFTGSSDERLKQNPSDFDALAIVAKLLPKEFEWKSNPGLRTKGFYAQELYQHYPEAVSVGGDTLTADGSLENPWGVDYGKLTPLLVKAVQELYAEVQALKKA